MIDSTKQYDAAIIGGGIIGCSIAWRLRQSGMRVVVIERGEMGREASAAAGGILAPLAEADQPDDFFQLCLASRAMYDDFARELRSSGGVDVEYRTEGALFLAFTEEDEAELEQRLQWQQAEGLNVKRLNAGCVLKLEPMINDRLRWAMKFPDDHQVNNRQLTIAVCIAARTAGVEFLTHTEARQVLIECLAGREKVAGIMTSRGEIKSGLVIVAAGSWSSLLTLGDGQPLDYFKVEPVRGQMVSVEMPAPSVKHVIYSRRGYLIPRYDGYLIAGSTTEHVGYDKRVTAGGIAAIISHAEEILPSFDNLPITETWSGLRPRSADDLPILGPDPKIEGLIYATAHYRNGILLTPITAAAISELVIRGESRINLAPFSVTRFKPRQAAG